MKRVRVMAWSLLSVSGPPVLDAAFGRLLLSFPVVDAGSRPCHRGCGARREQAYGPVARLGAVGVVRPARAATVALVASGSGTGNQVLGVLAVGFATAGALVASREPGNAVGWLLLAIALSFGFQALVDAYVGTRGCISPGCCCFWCSPTAGCCGPGGERQSGWE